MTIDPVQSSQTPTSTHSVVRALSIAGSDPSGGAGIQADLKSFAALGAYGMAAIASLTVQNTRGVRRVHSPPADFLADQLTAISDDIVVDTVKIGMLGTADNIAVVADWLVGHRPEFVVLDPVMVATSGDRLLTADAERAIRGLLPLADLLTPNVDELAVLTQEPAAADLESAIAQGRRLAAATGARVLVKGGHLVRSGATVATDALVTPDGGCVLLPGPLVLTKNTHGTGCSLSSALAALRPQRDSWERAAADAKSWLTGALAASDRLQVGSGAGPVHHFHHLWTQPQLSAEMWSNIAPIRDAIATMPFISALADGTLPWPNFAFYLQQDALYLREYARCLARVAAMAPDQDAQIFFAQASAGALEAELNLHRALLAEPRSATSVPDGPTASAVPHSGPASEAGPAADARAASDWVAASEEGRAADAHPAADARPASEAGPASVAGQRALGEPPGVADPATPKNLTAGRMSPVTAAYVDHLHRATSFGDFPEAIAAVLPCFWLYQHIGELIARRTAESDDPHPYGAWIATYADPAFAELTRTAIAMTDRAARTASADQRTAMADAFDRSSQYEWMFFAQGTDMPGWPV